LNPANEIQYFAIRIHPAGFWVKNSILNGKYLDAKINAQFSLVCSYLFSIKLICKISGG
jgi:hypothetical protein